MESGLGEAWDGAGEQVREMARSSVVTVVCVGVGGGLRCVEVAGPANRDSTTGTASDTCDIENNSIFTPDSDTSVVRSALAPRAGARLTLDPAPWSLRSRLSPMGGWGGSGTHLPAARSMLGRILRLGTQWAPIIAPLPSGSARGVVG